LLAFAPPLYLITNYLWSEAFFTVLLLVSLYYLLEYTNDDKNYKALIIATLCAFLYCLQRNTGIFFVMASTLFLLFHTKKRKSLPYPIAFSGIALSGWAAWTIYHYTQRGLDFQPTLYEIGDNIFVNLATYLDRLSLWLLPTNINSVARSILCAVFIIVTLAYAAKFVQKNSTKYSGKIVLFIVLILVNYIGGMCLLEKANEWEVDRFIAILYPLCLLLLGFIINDYLCGTVGYKKKMLQILLLGAIVYPSIRSVKNCHFWHNSHCINTLNNSK
jgi:hypothetical protein